MYSYVQDVKVLNDDKLNVLPSAEKDAAHFILHRLKNKLPTVVVKVRMRTFILQFPCLMLLKFLAYQASFDFRALIPLNG